MAGRRVKTMTMPTKTVRRVSINDVKLSTPALLKDDSDDLLVIDNITNIDFPEQTLQMCFLAFCYCTRGRIEFNANAQHIVLTPGDLFIGVGEQMIEKTGTGGDYEGHAVLVSHECMQNSIVGLHQLWPFLLHLYRQPVIHLAPHEQEWVTQSYAEVLRRFRARDHHYRRESLSALIRLFYFDMCDVLRRRVPAETPRQPGSYGVFDRFIRLLAENFRRERNVCWYSEQLCLTPKYLSEVVKNVSGRTAGQWITSFVVMEIKQLLANTSLSIKEIAAELNFSNQSFLGKYFKNATGLAPSDFRR